MQQIPLTDLPGSQLFHDVLRDPSRWFQDAVTPELITIRAAAGIQRSQIVDLITTSMQGVTLSDAQRGNLEILTDPTSLISTTGQQVGVLGGPLYTLLKIRSMVQAGNDITAAHAVPVVPLFWLEDNDHDAAEASTTVLPIDETAGTFTHWDGTDDRQPVSRRIFTAGDTERITAMLEHVTGRYADDVREEMTALYTEGRPWAYAFLRLLQPVLAEWGVLVINASEIIRSGVHRDLMGAMLDRHTELQSAYQQSTQAVIDAGFHAQADIPEVPFFYIDQQGRQRIERNGDAWSVGAATMTWDELRSEAHEHPERFSPTVVTRPILQDGLLPTIAAVIGPGEIAYQTQLVRAYDVAGVTRPAMRIRHMACLLDAKAERNLDKAGRDVTWFFRSLDKMQGALNEELSAEAIPEIPDLSSTMTIWETAANEIDPTLVKTVGSTGAQIEAAFQALAGKLRGALKKRDQQIIDRHLQLWWALYPNATMNERVYPLAMWAARIGKDELRIIVEQVCRQSRSALTVIGVHDLPTA